MVAGLVIKKLRRRLIVLLFTQTKNTYNFQTIPPYINCHLTLLLEGAKSLLKLMIYILFSIFKNFLIMK